MKVNIDVLGRLVKLFRRPYVWFVNPHDPSVVRIKAQLWKNIFLAAIATALLVGTVIYVGHVFHNLNDLFTKTFGATVLVMVLQWWYSAVLVVQLTGAVKADDSVPEHKAAKDALKAAWDMIAEFKKVRESVLSKKGKKMALRAIVSKHYGQSGKNRKERRRRIGQLYSLLKDANFDAVKTLPQLFIWDNPMPNAAMTGPVPGKWAVIMTTGCLYQWLGKDPDLVKLGLELDITEVIAILLHEAGHGLLYHTAVKACTAVVASALYVVIDPLFSLASRYLGPVIKRLIDKLPPQARMLAAEIANRITTNLFGMTVREVTGWVQAFISRALESQADAMSNLISGHPCWLSTGLQKIVAYSIILIEQAKKKRAAGRPLYDCKTESPSVKGLWGMLSDTSVLRAYRANVGRLFAEMRALSPILFYSIEKEVEEPAMSKPADVGFIGRVIARLKEAIDRVIAGIKATYDRLTYGHPVVRRFIDKLIELIENIYNFFKKIVEAIMRFRARVLMADHPPVELREEECSIENGAPCPVVIINKPELRAHAGEMKDFLQASYDWSNPFQLQALSLQEARPMSEKLVDIGSRLLGKAA